MQKDTGRRGEVRVKARLKVKFKSFSSFITEYTHNISKGGIFIRTTQPCELRDKVEVVLVLPDTDQEVLLKGEVMHVIPESEATDQFPAGMGIQITEIRQEYLSLIDDFIAKKLEQEGVDGLGRREHKRYPSRLRVRFGSKQALVDEYLQNISHGGIFIQTKNQRNINELIDIVLIHPTTGEEFKLMGEVVRVVTGEDVKQNPRLKEGMGVRFVDMDEFHQRQIDLFIGAERAREETKGN